MRATLGVGMPNRDASADVGAHQGTKRAQASTGCDQKEQAYYIWNIAPAGQPFDQLTARQRRQLSQMFEYSGTRAGCDIRTRLYRLFTRKQLFVGP